MNALIPRAAIATALGATLIGAALAGTVLPPVHHAGKIDYLTGGVGQNEAAAIEKAAAHWPLALEFAVKDGKRADYAADVRVTVRDAKGLEALMADSTGPWMLARLPSGHYTVDATFGGRTLHHGVDVQPGHAAKAVFVWPAGTGSAHG